MTWNDNLFRSFGIEPLVILDGITPKYFVEEEKILDKSFRVWDKVSLSANNQNLNEEVLRRFGARFYQQEIVSFTS